MQMPVYPGRGIHPDWNNPHILQRNLLPPAACLVPFPDLASCRHACQEHRRYASPSVMPLCGEWDFRHYPSLLQLPENILSFRSGFVQRRIPETEPVIKSRSRSESSGTLPFPRTPLHVPSDQPVLVYRRVCRLPLLWSTLRKRLVMHGVRSACHIFVNGKAAGYMQGGCLPARLDITALLHDGDNELFVLTYPYAVGSYLEKQPVQAITGLVGDIYLEAVPSLSLHDLSLVTVWQADQDSWQLKLTAELTSCRIALDRPVLHASLYDQDECLLTQSWPVHLEPADSDRHGAPVQSSGLLQTVLDIPGVKSWCDETPVLYDLYLKLDDQHGKDLVCYHQAVGFRDIQYEAVINEADYPAQPNRIVINGRPLQLRTVCWPLLEEPNPLTRLPDVIHDLRQIKQAGLNAVYFQHYPPDPILLDLCDIYGLYVIADAPVDPDNACWSQQMAQDDPDLLEAWCLDRLERLVRRDFNHACVVAWSCGLLRAPDQLPDHPSDQPADARQNLRRRLAAHLRQLDPGRPLHGLDFPDLCLPLDRWQAGPVTHPSQGFDWLRFPDGGETGWCMTRYPLTDVWLDLLRQHLCPVSIQAVDAAAGFFKITNRQTWTDLTSWRFSWELLRQGRAVLSGELDGLRAEPGQNCLASLYYGENPFADDADYLVRLTVWQDSPSLWSVSGRFICSREFDCQRHEGQPASQAFASGRLRLESERHHLIVSGPRFWMVFNRIQATLESWRVGDRELFAARASQNFPDRLIQLPEVSGLHCRLMRPLSQIDSADWPSWQERGYDRLWTQVISLEDGCDGKSALIDTVALLGAANKKPGFRLTMRQEIMTSGEIRLFASLTSLEDALPPPCFSLCFIPSKVCQSVHWYGWGPLRSQIRQPLDGTTGQFESTLAELANQDRQWGVFARTRSLSLHDGSGAGLTITSDRLFAFDARVYPSDAAAGYRLENHQAERYMLQIFHQNSLAGQPMTEPMKMTFYLKPATSTVVGKN